MKKLFVAIFVLIIALMLFGTVVNAIEEKNILETDTTSKLINMKEENKTELEKYREKYNSESYALTAYVLNKVRIYSIPLCFVGIVVGALYQYILGTRRLDAKHKGFGLIIASITILVICQVLPLVFAIVVRGWRG